MQDLLKDGVRVINIGIGQFFDDMKAQGVETVNMDWKPPTAKASLLAGLKKLKN